MKRTVAIVFVAMLAVGVAQAADFITNPNPGTVSSGAPFSPDLPNITQSVDPATVAAGGIACGDGTFTTDNFFFRRFFLNTDHSITVQYNVTSVDVGIETVNVYVGTSVPITMSTFGLTSGTPMTFASLGSALGSTTRAFGDGVSLVVENFPLTGSILDPVAEDLVIQMFYPNAAADEWGIWPGTNSAGETQPGYLAAVDCGLAEPTTLASIGFPDVHFVLTVNGDEQVVPTPTPSGAAEPVPSLNNYGIIAMVLLLVGVGILVMWRRS